MDQSILYRWLGNIALMIVLISPVIAVLVLLAGKRQGIAMRITAAVYLVICVLGCAVWALVSSRSAVLRVTPEPPSHYYVEYRVAGTAQRAALTYTSSQGGTEQHEVVVPWRALPFSVAPPRYVALIVANSGLTGTVSCEIRVDGQTWRTATSDGAFAAASCAGVVGVGGE